MNPTAVRSEVNVTADEVALSVNVKPEPDSTEKRILDPQLRNYMEKWAKAKGKWSEILEDRWCDIKESKECYICIET